MQGSYLQQSDQFQTAFSHRGRLVIASCRSGSNMAIRVAEQYRQCLAKSTSEDDLIYLENIDSQFSDSETRVRLEQDVRGCDVFLFQALYDPTSDRSIDENYMAFLIAARAIKEWGARRLTAVLPYLAYARQDKPTPFYREPVTARLMADLTLAAGVDRMVVWHPHKNQLQALYGRIFVHSLEPWPLFTQVFRVYAGRPDVILVSPDAGAAKFVTKVGRALDLDCAIASKYRPQSEEAAIREVIGDFTGKQTAIVLDDMISSGGTVYALVMELAARKGIREIHLGVSHNLCLPAAYQRLLDLHKNASLAEFVATNSIPQTDAFLSLSFYRVLDLSGLFAEVIYQIHTDQPIRWGAEEGTRRSRSENQPAIEVDFRQERG